jgi:predicted RNA-binding Zn-ribbon protein involved in translation (DUF1610 family)
MPVADVVDHTADIGVSAEAPFSGFAANYTDAIRGSDDLSIQPTVETKHVVCPWCWEAPIELSNRDGRFHGMTYVQRTYRCEGCGLTLYANQDPRPL